MTEIEQVIDLERYPVHEPTSPGYSEILEQGKLALQSNALYVLEAFIRPHAITLMTAELESRFADSCRYDVPRIAYVSPDNSLPEQHPRNQVHPCRYNQVLNYQIPNDSCLRQVFNYQPLTDFLGELCGYETFHRSECPHLALTAKIASGGDTDGWHFDSNDVVFSILLQSPESGGEFEYAPYIRSETQQNYGGVGAVFDDPQNNAQRPAMGIGNLTVFKGDLSVHRVTPVTGEKRRIVALFSYDRNPGTTFPQDYIEELHASL